MFCRHAGYHTIQGTYERSTGTLVYLWTCESCGKRLGEAARHEYRPQFDPHGNERFLVQAAEVA